MDCRYHERGEFHSAVVKGSTPLLGAEITVPDIRGGFAYVIAAAAAEGGSVLHDVHHLERGYHRPLEAFAQLGLQIDRVTEPD
jgi:UDP-N-acetylglucosamine 1-carboxyvinyltransferase